MPLWSQKSVASLRFRTAAQCGNSVQALPHPYQGAQQHRSTWAGTCAVPVPWLGWGQSAQRESLWHIGDGAADLMLPKMSVHLSRSVLYVCFHSCLLKHVSQTFLLTSKKAGKQMSKMHPFCVCHMAHSGVTLCKFVSTGDLQKSWTHNSVFSSCQRCLCSGLCIGSVWHHQWRTAAGKRVQDHIKD